MQAPRAGLDPAPRHRRRVLAEDRRIVHVALLQAHAVTVFQVDRRDQQHGRSDGGERDRRRAEPRRARRSGVQRQGFQCEEVAVQRQAVVGAFFGMELGRENVIARQRRGKAAAVLGFARAVARVRRAGVEAVHEIEVAAVGHARPERVRPGLEDLVPAHLRHLEAAAVGLQAAVEAEAHDLAGDQAERRRPVAGRPSSLRSSSICMPTQTPSSGLVGRRLEHRLLQARLAQLAHAVGHRALARQDDALGGGDLVRGAR